MSHSPQHGEVGRREDLALALAALGVVFGDIGTSPIYAIRESFHASYGIAASAENMLGVLSLIFWSLIIVITIKYLALVLRADNRGEGGIIALTALVAPPNEHTGGRRRVLVLLGLFGAALLYGDSIITPAISVLSAIEGLEIATPLFQPYIIPITAGILVGLFSMQRRGTAGIGAIFGPITLVWFLTLALMGTIQVVQNPGVLAALNPLQAYDFFARNEIRGLLVLGSVFLVVTGGEALYADMGHFGTKPIRMTWFAIVLPSLLLNYFGQGALILRDPEAIEHPFFLMAPSWALYPLVALTTCATVIASQAVISGAFSLTRQAVQLGYLPRLRIDHKSDRHAGQIYMPSVNWALMIACIALVLGFRNSSNLASAYGVAVTTDMVFTTILFAVVARSRWRWGYLLLFIVIVPLFIVDVAFWSANIPKIPSGGWFPLLIAGVMFVLMTTWNRGRKILGRRLNERVVPLRPFLEGLAADPPIRVPGTAVFMASSADGTPHALVHNVKHNKVLHERIIFLTVATSDVPHVHEQNRVEVQPVGDEGFYRIVLHYGFAQDPDVPSALASINLNGSAVDVEETTFFLGRENLISTPARGMATWREKLFARMSRNARGATLYFRIPPHRVVELGTQIEL